MLICGLNDGHNAAAALLRDGILIGALQEERPRRAKNWQGFPDRSIDLLLKDAGASWADVDAFALSGFESLSVVHNRVSGNREAQMRAYKSVATLMGEARRILRHTPLRTGVQQRRLKKRLNPFLDRGVPAERIHCIEHHRCHALTAQYGSGSRPDALVVTLDGSGDGLCATVNLPLPDGSLKRIASIDETHSIGILWALVTSLLGMVPLEHEYKMMGMAPYAGGPRVRAAANTFAKAFVAKNGLWRRASRVPEMAYSYHYWRDALEFVRFDDLCGGLQLFTEELVSAWIKYWLVKTGLRRLRLSGGVFMNVKLNKVLAELPEVDDLYVFPSCSDETNAIGAAWACAHDLGAAQSIQPLRTLYLGVEPANGLYDEAAAVAKKEGFKTVKPADIGDAAAALLAEGQVVARVSGREEFGARALGNRSILADPSRRDVVRVINSAIKARDFWMPFASSMLAEDQDRYLKNPKRIAAPYMILTFDSLHTEEIQAGCHPEDGTVRPQVVERADNPQYHHLISRFRARTGRGAILNTSFNIHGEPIVSTPLEALDVLRRSGLAHLALGPWLISKAL